MKEVESLRNQVSSLTSTVYASLLVALIAIAAAIVAILRKPK